MDINEIKLILSDTKKAYQEKNKALINLLLNIGINIKEANEFVTANPNFLSNIVATGITEDNPFLVFFKLYNKKNKNIKPFLNQQNYNHIFNIYVKGILDAKQLNFTCEEENKPKILLNHNFWEQTKDIDIEWYIQLWEWCSSNYPEEQILNICARILFSDIDETYFNNNSKFKPIQIIQKVASNIRFNTPEKIEQLRKSLIFTPSFLNTVNEIDEIIHKGINNKSDIENLIRVVNDFRNKVASDVNYCYSARLVPTSLTNEIIRELNEKVNLSNRDIDGKYQKMRGDAELGKTSGYKPLTKEKKEDAIKIFKSLGVQNIENIVKNKINLSREDKKLAANYIYSELNR